MAECDNAVLNYLARRLGVGRPDVFWLLTLLTALPAGRFPLSDWNGALSLAAGRRICCPSYRILNSYLQRLALDVK